MTKEDLQRALESAPDGTEVRIEDNEGTSYGVALASYDPDSDEFVIEMGDADDAEGWDEDEDDDL